MEKERLDIRIKAEIIFFSGYPFPIATKSIYTSNNPTCTNQETGIRFNMNIDVCVQQKWNREHDWIRIGKLKDDSILLSLESWWWQKYTFLVIFRKKSIKRERYVPKQCMTSKTFNKVKALVTF